MIGVSVSAAATQIAWLRTRNAVTVIAIYGSITSKKPRSEPQARSLCHRFSREAINSGIVDVK